MNKFGLSQQDAAKVLGVTQASISNYLRGARAPVKLVDNADTEARLTGLAKRLVSRPHKKEEIMSQLTDVCNYILSTRQVCDIHAKMDPGLDVSSCDACNELITLKVAEQRKTSTPIASA